MAAFWHSRLTYRFFTVSRLRRRNSLMRCGPAADFRSAPGRPNPRSKPVRSCGMTPCPRSRRRAAASSTAARNSALTSAGRNPSRREDPSFVFRRGHGRHPAPAWQRQRRLQVIQAAAPYRVQRHGSPGGGCHHPRLDRPLQFKTHPRSDERLYRSIALFHFLSKGWICSSRMTARHSTLSTL